mmetsp:Transcript_48603/g.95914  ORF Transcript_48603/g.95914 Transcript_48603/m.95914 type:complete len:87 (+) Transcript_48603:154-414(+)
MSTDQGYEGVFWNRRMGRRTERMTNDGRKEWSGLSFKLKTKVRKEENMQKREKRRTIDDASKPPVPPTPPGQRLCRDSIKQSNLLQ